MSSDFRPPALAAVADEVAQLLKARKETLAIAETAAGGLVAASLLAVPGSSAFFRGAVTAYSLPARSAWLGWTEADTEGYDGPNEAIVTKLATAARERLSTTWAISESGCAGPTKPDKYRAEIAGPGYCALAVVGPVNATNVIDTAQADRPLNMVLFAIATLELLRETMKSTEAKAKS